MNIPIKTVHNISRPGEAPREDDIIEVETVGGFVEEVDPTTRKTTGQRKQFVITSDGGRG